MFLSMFPRFFYTPSVSSVSFLWLMGEKFCSPTNYLYESRACSLPASVWHLEHKYLPGQLDIKHFSSFWLLSCPVTRGHILCLRCHNYPIPGKFSLTSSWLRSVTPQPAGSHGEELMLL